MGKSIELSDNIKECIGIIDKYVNSKETPDDKTVINAMKYLSLTMDSALRGKHEPDGCPVPNKKKPVGIDI